MAVTLLSCEQLAGVHEKLKRADESIRNLNSEITAFLKPPKGVFSEDKEKASHEFLKHARRNIPPRFGVLAGEIAHHLRASLDHIVWLLSSEQYRRKHETLIAFPICLAKPRKKEEITRYNGKIQGIRSASARTLIDKLQPYNAAHPPDDPLVILHNLDRIDKHQTLILIRSNWSTKLSIPLRLFTWTIIGRPDLDQKIFTPTTADKLKMDFSIQIAFAQLGRWKGEAVIPALTHLSNTIQDYVKRFSELRI
jgi:hypothetical protein